ncbi:NAD(P)-binding protein [Tothia fuscella]|uniref:NAD(P)-binding protein n=1 Tax=Tothia fuscella TaxID=1048955 RepID=A0A9P4NJH0_9PEZI|nr:NAD(P)-binding protein [Tothia fuscella]
MSKLIVIISITGTQGSSVAKTFANIPGWRIRGITRNPNSAAAQEFASKGVEIVKADSDNKGSLITAFRGAHAIFAVTDFWQHFNNPENHGKAAVAGTKINEYAFDLEVAQGINIAEAAADVSVLKTLERFIFSSLADIENYIKDELPKLASKMSTVQIGFYAHNWKMAPILQPRKEEDGTYVFTQPENNEKPVPFVVTWRDTGSFVKALVELPPGKNLLGVSEFMTWEQFVETWGRVLRVKARVEVVDADNFYGAQPEVVREELRESFLFDNEFGWTGGDPDVQTPDEIGVEIARTSIAEYIREEDWSSVL